MKRQLNLVVVLLVTGASLACGNIVIQNIVDQVSQANYTNYLDNMLYTHMGDDRGFGPEHDLARDFIFSEFSSFGLDTIFHDFYYNSEIYSNIVAAHYGTIYPDNIYIVGAHYDSKDNPGADDNASGVSCILEAARILSQYSFESTLLFIAFDREEQNRTGSTAYVQDHADDNILGMVSVDMIAYNPYGTNKAKIYGRETSAPLKQSLADSISLYGNGLGSKVKGQFDFSDHGPFEEEGFQACMFIEYDVWDNNSPHEPNDSVDNPGYIDYAYATDMTRAAVGFFASAAIPFPVIYVDTGAVGANDGSSWEDAYNYLQDALANAAYGDNIFVAEGTYTPDANSLIPDGSGDRTATFQLISGVGLYGDFPIGGSDFANRDPNQYETILSGDLTGNDNPATPVEDLLNDPNRADNCYHVFYHPQGLNLDPNSMLNGFTITAGNANGSGNHSNGGGMFNVCSSPTVTNCTFIENAANGGGGMHNDLSSNTVVTNCTFISNSSVYGGGGMANNSSNPTETDCIFNNNSVDSNYGDGGGIINIQSTPKVAGCTFADNSARMGAGMSNWDNSTPEITGCTFTGNSANDKGGGMYNSGSSPPVIDCTFSGNFAWEGGGMYNSNNSNPMLTNCIIIDNMADFGGGGIYNIQSSPTVTYCTFSSNTVDDSFGGGMYNKSSSSPTVTNCILWGNTASLDGNEIALRSGSTIDLDYCDVQGGLTGIYDDEFDDAINWGTGNIDADPLFVDAANGDYHLKSEGWRWDNDANNWTWDDVTSPCIDAGNPGALLGGEPMTLDLDPLNRWGQNLRINMGAYGGTEYASMPPFDWTLLADLTNDGIVNLEDFANQAIDWQNTNPQQPGDLNRDDTVDINDALLMANGWLKTTTWY